LPYIRYAKLMPLYQKNTSGVYEAGTHSTSDCKVSKNCLRDASVPRPEKTILVLSRTPVHNKIGIGVGLAVAAGAGVAELPGTRMLASLELPVSPLAGVH